MKKKLQEKLYKKYPLLFARKDWSQMDTCMCRGICCGDGWFNLINSLCQYIQFQTDVNNYHQLEIDQIKEKFGTLRFDVVESKTQSFGGKAIRDDKDRSSGISGAIRFAEFLSGNICENCGSPEGVSCKSKTNIMMTMCKECQKGCDLRG